MTHRCIQLYPLTLDAYRAAASAAWAHADEAGQEALSVPELTVGPPKP